MKRDEVKALFDKVHELIMTGKGDEEGLGKLAVFAGVHKFPSRVKCAILPWHTLHAALNSAGSASTESDQDPMQAPIGDA